MNTNADRRTASTGPIMTSRRGPRAVDGERPDREFQRLVNADLRDKFAAGPAYAVLSRPENRVRWLHTLLSFRESIKTQTAHDRAALHTHPDKPVGGGFTPQAYADAKREMSERQRSRDRATQTIIERTGEVRRLIGTDLIPERAIGAVVGDLLTALRCLDDGNAADARRKIIALIVALAGNSDDTPDEHSE